MTKRQIPGCREVSKEDVQKALNEGDLPYHRVHDRWYALEPGHDSLEKLVDAWLEEVLCVWQHVSFLKDGKREGNHTKTAHVAERLLKEWDVIDENGLSAWERE